MDESNSDISDSEMDDNKESNSDIYDKPFSFKVLTGCSSHKQSSCVIHHIMLYDKKINKCEYPYSIKDYISYKDSFSIFLKTNNFKDKCKDSILVDTNEKIKKVHFDSYKEHDTKSSNKVTCLAIYNEKYFAIGFANGRIKFFEKFEDEDCFGNIHELKQYKYNNSKKLPVKDIVFNSSGKMFVNITEKVNVYDICKKSFNSDCSIRYFEKQYLDNERPIFMRKKSIDFTCIKIGFFENENFLNEEFLLSGHLRGYIVLWDMTNYVKMKTFKYIESPIKDILISKYRNSFLTITENDKNLYIYKIEDEEPEIRDLNAIPTALSSDQKENILVIGFENGFLEEYSFPNIGTEKQFVDYRREEIKLDYSYFERINIYDIILSSISLLCLIGGIIEFIFKGLIPLSISLLCLSALLTILHLIFKWCKII